MTTVNFKTYSGANTSRKFGLSQGVSVYGKVTGALGLGEPGSHVRIDIEKDGSPIFFKETFTDLWGDYSFYFITPNEDCNMTVKITASLSISGQDFVTIPIAVGNRAVGSLPKIQGEGSWLDWIPVIVIGTLGILAVKAVKDFGSK